MRFLIHLFNPLLFLTVHLFSSNIQQINKDVSEIQLHNIPLQKVLRSNLKSKHYLLNLKQKNPIPKIIHFVWLGPHPIPPLNQKCMQSIRDLHPTWKIKLWTDADLKNSNFVLLPKILECKNYGLKSDILRYELLYKYGGVYVDVDFFANKPFDLLCEQHSMFMGTFYNTIMNSLMGCAPNHPLLKSIVKHLHKTKINPNAEGDEVQALTGPGFLTNITAKFLLKKARFADVVVYPPNYFFPNGHKIIHSSKKALLSNPILFNSLLYEETVAVHMYTTSWID